MQLFHALVEEFYETAFRNYASVILAVIFIGIFVAEASGNVLSANIITGTTALASTPRCFFPQEETLKYAGEWAARYSGQCYHAVKNTLGCSFFYNRSIGYTEQAHSLCPFMGNLCVGNLCASHLDPAYIFDTGYIDAKYIGINSFKQYHFRRRSTCAPLNAGARCMAAMSEDDYIKLVSESEKAGIEIRCPESGVPFHTAQAGILKQ